MNPLPLTKQPYNTWESLFNSEKAQQLKIELGCRPRLVFHNGVSQLTSLEQQVLTEAVLNPVSSTSSRTAAVITITLEDSIIFQQHKDGVVSINHVSEVLAEISENAKESVMLSINSNNPPLQLQETIDSNVFTNSEKQQNNSNSDSDTETTSQQEKQRPLIDTPLSDEQLPYLELGELEVTKPKKISKEVSVNSSDPLDSTTTKENIALTHQSYLEEQVQPENLAPSPSICDQKLYHAVTTHLKEILQHAQQEQVKIGNYRIYLTNGQVNIVKGDSTPLKDEDLRSLYKTTQDLETQIRLEDSVRSNQDLEL